MSLGVCTNDWIYDPWTGIITLDQVLPICDGDNPHYGNNEIFETLCKVIREKGENYKIEKLSEENEDEKVIKEYIEECQKRQCTKQRTQPIPWWWFYKK